jgi:SSS family solute:Na+ symporter
MSTLDSQLLALSSMLTRDLYKRYWRPQASLAEQVRVGRLAVIALAVAGLVIALRPPEAILSLATHAFSGLAVLFPMLVGAVYGLRWTVAGAMVSVLGGEAVLLGLALGGIPESFQMGYLPLIPALVVACIVLGVDQLVAYWRRA